MELVLSYPVETTDTDPGIIAGVIIAGVIIAGVIIAGGLGLVLLAVYCCYHKRKSKYEVNSTDTQMSSLILIVMAWGRLFRIVYYKFADPTQRGGTATPLELDAKIEGEKYIWNT